MESRIHDVWTKKQRVFSEHWTGRTMFDLLKPPIKAGWEWQAGRPTQIQATSRPPTVWVEIWRVMSDNQALKAIADYEAIRYEREEVRKKRGRTEIPAAEVEEYSKIWMEAIIQHSIPVAPAMPTVHVAASATYLQDMQSDECRGQPRAHQDKMAHTNFD